MNHNTSTGGVATKPQSRSGLDEPAVAFRLEVSRTIAARRGPGMSPKLPVAQDDV